MAISGVGSTRHLTSFSINGEHNSNTPSERRGCVLRGSVENLMVRYPSSTRGQIKAPFAGKNSTPSPPSLSSSGIGERLIKPAFRKACSAKLDFGFTEFSEVRKESCNKYCN